MKGISILIVVFIMLIPSQVYGFGYINSGFDLDIDVGNAGSFDFIVVGADNDASHVVSIMGEGADFYKYEMGSINDDNTIRIVFTVSIPDDYSGAAELVQEIYVTQSPNDKSTNVVLNQETLIFSKIMIAGALPAMDDSEDIIIDGIITDGIVIDDSVTLDTKTKDTTHCTVQYTTVINTRDEIACVFDSSVEELQNRGWIKQLY